MEARKPYPAGYPEEPETLGEHLKRVRLDRGLIRKEAAKDMGVHHKSLENWECGKHEVSLPIIPKVLRFLGYDPRPEGRTLGERLKRKREGEGLSQKELAERLGIDQSTVSTWERDAVRLRHPRLTAVFEEYVDGEAC